MENEASTHIAVSLLLSEHRNFMRSLGRSKSPGIAL